MAAQGGGGALRVRAGAGRGRRRRSQRAGAGRSHGARMEVLRLEAPRGWSGRAGAEETRRQLWSSGVLLGGKLSNRGREKLGGGCREARSPAPPPLRPPAPPLPLRPLALVCFRPCCLARPRAVPSGRSSGPWLPWGEGRYPFPGRNCVRKEQAGTGSLHRGT